MIKNKQFDNFAYTAKHQASATTQDEASQLILLPVQQQEGELSVCLSAFYFTKLSPTTKSQKTCFSLQSKALELVV